MARVRHWNEGLEGRSIGLQGGGLTGRLGSSAVEGNPPLPWAGPGSSDMFHLTPRSCHLLCPAAAELADCSNKLIELQLANETNANALGECRSNLTGVESQYQDCLRRAASSR